MLRSPVPSPCTGMLQECPCYLRVWNLTARSALPCADPEAAAAGEEHVGPGGVLLQRVEDAGHPARPGLVARGRRGAQVLACASRAEPEDPSFDDS